MSETEFSPPRRLVIGISGASGVIYGIRLLEMLQATPIETHLVMSRAAEITVAHETSWKLANIRALADQCYKVEDIGAALSSGSFRTLGMVIAPCSIKTMSEIAGGISSGLLARAADVTLKEQRRLVMMVRETPLHLGHLHNMAALAEMGAVIAPPVPAFYSRPTSLEEMVDHTLGRVLDLFDLDIGVVQRWKEPDQTQRATSVSTKSGQTGRDIPIEAR